MRLREITPEDVQITFNNPETTDFWSPANVIDIAYSTDPVAVHVPTVRLGHQVWEVLLNEGNPDGEKAIVTINVEVLPAPRSRTMWLRLRARVIETGTITDWSAYNSVRFIGKPGKPNQTK